MPPPHFPPRLIIRASSCLDEVDPPLPGQSKAMPPNVLLPSLPQFSGGHSKSGVFPVSLTMLGFKLIPSSYPSLLLRIRLAVPNISVSISPVVPCAPPDTPPARPHLSNSHSVSPSSFDILWGFWFLLYFAFFCFSVFLFLFFIGFREIMLNPISLPGHSKPLNHGIYVEDVNVYFRKGRHGF